MILTYGQNPINSLYYKGYLILDFLKKKNYKSIHIDKLFIEINETREISYKTFLLSLDWLFLIDSISINEIGEILCI